MTVTKASGTRIFRTSCGLKWFLNIFGCLGIVGCGYAVYSPFEPGRPFNLESVIVGIIFFGMGALLFAYIFFVLPNKRIEINGEEIRQIGLFSTKSLTVREIDGYRLIADRTLTLVPRTPDRPMLKIDLILQNSLELVDWAQQYFKDLNATGYEEDLAEIYRDENLGASLEEKAKTFKGINKCCNVLNISFLLLGMVWCGLWPRPYQMVIWFLAILPLVAMLFAIRFRGLVTLDAKRYSAYPSVVVAFLTAPLILAIRAVADWNILEWDKFWVPFALLSLGLLSAVYWLIPDLTKKFGKAMIFVLFCAAYGYGTTVTVNGILATSNYRRYHPKIIEKCSVINRGVTYYITLSPWGPKKKDVEVRVRRWVYNKYSIGDAATVYVRDGKFGIPFYFVR
jgi:hypothetical protein